MPQQAELIDISGQTSGDVETTLRFAIELIRNHGHALNEVCHEHQGHRGYCVGMAVILGSQANGRTYDQARAIIPDEARIWTELGVGGVLVGIGDWLEARRWVAWAYGFPRDMDPNEWADCTAVAPNYTLKTLGISPVPYLENAIAMWKGEPVPNELPPVEAWPKCSEGCGRVIPDADGPCEACGARLFGRKEPHDG